MTSLIDPTLMEVEDTQDCGSVVIIGGECHVVSDGVYRGIVYSAKRVKSFTVALYVSGLVSPARPLQQVNRETRQFKK